MHGAGNACMQGRTAGNWANKRRTTWWCRTCAHYAALPHKIYFLQSLPSFSLNQFELHLGRVQYSLLSGLFCHL
jgi:hypothetical protein